MKEVLKFIYRFIKHLIIFLLILVPLQLTSIVALAIYLPIHLKLVSSGIKKSIKLPYLLRWFDNADQYIGRDVSTYLGVFGSGYSNLLYWLTLRNPLNYFGYVILGVQIKEPINQVLYTDLETIDVSDATGGRPGLFYTDIIQDGKTYYEYYYIYKYSATKCFRFRMGHKLGLLLKAKHAQFVGVLSPYHSYNGI